MLETRRAALCLSSTLLLIASATACGDDGAANTDTTTSSSGDSETGGSSGRTEVPSDGIGSSGQPEVSSSSGAPSEPCTPRCRDATVALECTSQGPKERSCPLGCDESNASCRSFDPLGDRLEPADVAAHEGEAELLVPGVGPAVLQIDTSTGAIHHNSTLLRDANTFANAIEQNHGITFERRDGRLGVFHARRWLLPNVRVIGDLPLVLIATDTIEVQGQVYATCGQVGGAGLGSPSIGNGGDSTVEREYHSGAGGGGFGGLGGRGGTAWGQDGALLEPGGGGRLLSFDANNPHGGGRGGRNHGTPGLGGGVVMMLAGTSITLGTGSLASFTPHDGVLVNQVPMGINVGGCGGQRGGNGGGAGGLIVLEAPSVDIAANAGLGANGGGGGGAIVMPLQQDGNGLHGQISASPALGGTPSVTGGEIYGAGGAGATGTSAAGAGQSTLQQTKTKGGGGGGGVGRIVIRTRDASLHSDDRSILSPAPDLDTLDVH